MKSAKRARVNGSGRSFATEMDRQTRKSAQEQKRLIREREEHERRGYEGIIATYSGISCCP